jgi:hypothetical protein
MIEVKVMSLTTVVSLKISSIEPQGELELQQFWRLSSLNSEECSSATAIDMTTKKHRRKKPKKGDQIKGKKMAMLVFNPCIMVFSPLFNGRVMMLGNVQCSKLQLKEQ